MKRAIVYILFLSLISLTGNSIAQDSTKTKTAEDVINIKELVAQQIREIQESEAIKENGSAAILTADSSSNKSENEPVLIGDNSNSETENATLLIGDNPQIDAESAEIISVSKEDTPLIQDIYIKIIIGVESILLLLMIYFWYKKKSTQQRSDFSDLKKNIRRLREEKIGGLLDDTLTKVRSQLVLKVANLDSRNITAQAKKLSISKGELHLAAKINLMTRKA